MKSQKKPYKMSKKTQRRSAVALICITLGLFGINTQPVQDALNSLDLTLSQTESIETTAEGVQFSLIDEAKAYARSASASDENADKVQVVRVVDGDTLIVRLKGEQVRVRLIGIDAPESVHPDAKRNSEQGKTASEHLKAGLHKGDVVYLTYDKEQTDKYKRTLAYVWLDTPPQDPSESDVAHLMLNGVLVSKGYANPKAFKPNTHFKKTFEHIAQARI